jgi:hypothetical protein
MTAYVATHRQLTRSIRMRSTIIVIIRRNEATEIIFENAYVYRHNRGVSDFRASESVFTRFSCEYDDRLTSKLCRCASSIQ